MSKVPTLLMLLLCAIFLMSMAAAQFILGSTGLLFYFALLASCIPICGFIAVLSD